jgi:hypothetical protein
MAAYSRLCTIESPGDEMSSIETLYELDSSIAQLPTPPYNPAIHSSHDTPTNEKTFYYSTLAPSELLLAR